MTRHLSAVDQTHRTSRGSVCFSLFLVTEAADLVEYQCSKDTSTFDREASRLVPIPYSIVPHRTIEGVAAHLARHLQQMQPTAPYLLLGRGIRGGIIACELAAQLVGQDRHVGFVGLIDDDCMTATSCSSIGKEASAEPDTAGERLLTSLFGGAGLFELMQTFGRKVDSRVVSIFTRDDKRPQFHIPSWENVLRSSAHLVRIPTRHGVATLDATLLASAIRAHDDSVRWREFDYIPDVLVQQGAPGHTPVFCIPGAGDNGAVFAPFAEALGPGWPVHALQARGLDGKLNPHTTVEAVAASNARRIAALSPADAVHLVGHSFGGWVALEIGRQLQAMGCKVESITMVDSEAPMELSLPPEHTTLEIFSEFVSLFELSINGSLNISFEELENCGHQERLRLLHRAIVRAGLMSARSTPTWLAGPIKVFSAALRTNYLPPAPYPHEARLILLSNPQLDAHANERSHLDMVTTWKRWVPQLAIHHSSGCHFTALKNPHVTELVAYWKRANRSPAREG